MPSAAISTVVTMMETLPESVQDQVVDRVREYLADLEDDRRWDDAFRGSQAGLAASARRARREIAEGMATPLDPDLL